MTDNSLTERLLSEEPNAGDGSSFGLGGEFKFDKVFVNTYNNKNSEAKELFEKYCKNISYLSQQFKTDLKKGLDENNVEDFKEREAKWGNNKPKPEDPNHFFSHVVDCLKDPTLRVLLAAAAISFIIGVLKEGIRSGWLEGTAIFFAVFLVVTISSYQNWSQQEEFLKLERQNKIKEVTIVRNGKEKVMKNIDVVAGDVLKLQYGNIAVVDGVVIDGEAKMDEGPVTGESTLFTKKPEPFNGHFSDWEKTSPIVFSGTNVSEGEMHVLVVAVGKNTFAGRTESLSEIGANNLQNTVLQNQLDGLAELIEHLGFAMAVAIGSIMFLKELIITLYHGQTVFSSHMLDVLVNSFIIAVTVLVVAIPEGLPMASVIALSYSVAKMKADKNHVKKIEKAETMGTVDNICTDKTGTLTKGEMSLVSLYVYEKVVDIVNENRGQNAQVNQNEQKELPELLKDEVTKSLIQDNMYLNLTAEEVQNDKGEEVLVGNMTECGFYRFLKEYGFDYKSKKNPVVLFPFDSKNKFNAVVYRNKQDAKKLRVYLKGAPDVLIRFCGKILTDVNTVVEYKEANAKKFNGAIETFADAAKRTLLFGFKDITEEEFEQAKTRHEEMNADFWKDVGDKFTMAFMSGIRDQYREGVDQDIIACHGAGITVRMVTGDNIDTAIAISKEIHIIQENQAKEAKKTALKMKELLNGRKEGSPVDDILPQIERANIVALEGEVFRVLIGGTKTVEIPDEKGKKIAQKEYNNFKAFEAVTRNLRIIARCSPEDKFTLVFGLKKQKHICAVTGDGTNDAPALKVSNVGFSMGIRGTDIAKAAADIILMDDSFHSIVKAVMYGRNVYDCIRKFVQFQLTVNVVAVFMTLLGGIILKDSPLNAIQMLWVNLIMDSFASLALATESPHKELLDRKPVKEENNIVTNFMLTNIISQSIYQIMLLTVIVFYGDVIFGVPSDRELEHFMWNNVNGYHFTIFFDIFVFMQVCNSINSRKLKKEEKNVFSGIFGNNMYILIQSIIIIGQCLMVTFGGRAVRVQRLSVLQHLECLGVGALTLVIGFLVKFIPIDTTEEVAYGDDQEKPKEKIVTKSFGYASRGGKTIGFPKKN